MNGFTSSGALVATTCVVLVGCADTVNPNRSGLRLGLEDGPLRPPAAVKGDVFEFPRSAWEDGISGTTVLKIMIDADGTVDSAIVLESSGNDRLDSAAPSEGCGRGLIPPSVRLFLYVFMQSFLFSAIYGFFAS